MQHVATLYGLLERQTHRDGRRPAVVFRQAVVSYHELHERVLRLAGGLRARGVRPGDVVAIHLERGLDLVAAPFAVSAVGGVWLTLDPRCPVGRRQQILATARPRLVLTDPGDELSDFPCDSVTTAPPAQPAYVVLTSGTTGTPKGAVIANDGLEPLVDGFQRLLQLEPGTRLLQASSPAFDVFVLELALTVHVGGTLCVAPTPALAPGRELEQSLRELDIQAVSLTPSAHATIDPRAVPALHTLITGGEAVTRTQIARWECHSRRIFNAYGPSEATVAVALGMVSSETGVVDVGAPLPGVRAGVADEAGEPVPDGGWGELVVAGPCVGLGYLGEPVDGRGFVTGRYRWLADGHRVYRTGDQARRLPDGRYEIAGRLDDQAKVRGHRIEPAELDALAEQVAGVRSARTRAVRLSEDDVRLVTYVIADPSPTDADLPRRVRDHLADHVSSAVVPGAVLPVTSFPTTLNGKLDWDQLPLPWHAVDGPSRPNGDVRMEGPAHLAAVQQGFAQVLRCREIGPDDDFVEHGGHSLLATRLAHRLATTFDVDLTGALLLELRTPWRTAEWIDKALTG